MPPVRLEHSGSAAATTLTGSLAAGATDFDLADPTGWPTGSVGDFVVTVDAGTATEERILCSGRVGSTVTVAVGGRGYDGTTDQAHANGANGATAAHTFSATEADEANEHVMETTTAHGLTIADVVLKDATQTLTGKTLTAPSMTAPDASGDLSGFGGPWTDWTPTLNNFTATVTHARYMQVGKTVHFVAVLSLTSVLSGDLRIDPPVTPDADFKAASSPCGSAWALDVSSGTYAVGVAYIYFSNGSIKVAATSDWTTNYPFVWAAGDVVRICGTYEAA